jgi:hypothetical protein
MSKELLAKLDEDLKLSGYAKRSRQSYVRVFDTRGRTGLPVRRKKACFRGGVSLQKQAFLLKFLSVPSHVQADQSVIRDHSYLPPRTISL